MAEGATSELRATWKMAGGLQVNYGPLGKWQRGLQVNYGPLGKWRGASSDL